MKNGLIFKPITDIEQLYCCKYFWYKGDTLEFPSIELEGEDDGQIGAYSNSPIYEMLRTNYNEDMGIFEFEAVSFGLFRAVRYWIMHQEEVDFSSYKEIVTDYIPPDFVW